LLFALLGEEKNEGFSFWYHAQIHNCKMIFLLDVCLLSVFMCAKSKRDSRSFSGRGVKANQMQVKSSDVETGPSEGDLAPIS